MCYYSISLSTSFIQKEMSHAWWIFIFPFSIPPQKLLPTSSHLTRHTTQTFSRPWADLNLIWFILSSCAIEQYFWASLFPLFLLYACSFKWEINFLCHINNTTLSINFWLRFPPFSLVKILHLRREHKWLRPHLS